MKLVCSVYDVKAKLWSTPFYSHSAVVATRDFSAAVRGDGAIAQFPQDYELYSIGRWSDETGIFSPDDQFSLLARGSDFSKES